MKSHFCTFKNSAVFICLYLSQCNLFLLAPRYKYDIDTEATEKNGAKS